MRTSASSSGVTVHATAGNHAVFLAMDLDPVARTGCLGWAVQRTDHTENETRWLPGFKTFRSVEPSPSSKLEYASNTHPVQSMWWGDYSAKPAHSYTYRVVAVRGTPSSLQLGEAATVEVSTSDPATGTHGIYFNRGVAASQAYTTKFGAAPDKLPDEKRTAALAWLSRGVHEALLAFIGDGAGPGVVIRAAVYEFTEPAALAAFKTAVDAGADVRIVVHAKPGDPQTDANTEAIQQAGLAAPVVIPRTHPVIAHNKFIIRGHTTADGTVMADQVWTGSTNISRGGIFGHSNVAHIVRQPAIAETYLAYWTELSGDPVAADLKDWVDSHNPWTAPDATQNTVAAAFSPRHQMDPLAWYADAFATTEVATAITLPFGMETEHIEAAVLALTDQGPLHLTMLNKKDPNQATWSQHHSVHLAVGDMAKPGEMAIWAGEALTGFNPMVPYLHTKILLNDLLGPRPTVVSGSANFSKASTTANDENMVITTGDTELADVYLTEYLRVFQHFYSRWWAEQLQDPNTQASYLTENDSWQTPYFQDGNHKNRLRKMFTA